MRGGRRDSARRRTRRRGRAGSGSGASPAARPAFPAGRPRRRARPARASSPPTHRARTRRRRRQRPLRGLRRDVAGAERDHGRHRDDVAEQVDRTLAPHPRERVADRGQPDATVVEHAFHDRADLVLVRRQRRAGAAPRPAILSRRLPAPSACRPRPPRRSSRKPSIAPSTPDGAWQCDELRDEPERGLAIHGARAYRPGPAAAASYSLAVPSAPQRSIAQPPCSSGRGSTSRPSPSCRRTSARTTWPTRTRSPTASTSGSAGTGRLVPGRHERRDPGAARPRRAVRGAGLSPPAAQEPGDARADGLPADGGGVRVLVRAPQRPGTARDARTRATRWRPPSTRLHASIEVVAGHLVDWMRQDVWSVIADNGTDGAEIVGTGCALHGADLAAVPVTLERNGELGAARHRRGRARRSVRRLLLARERSPRGRRRAARRHDCNTGTATAICPVEPWRPPGRDVRWRRSVGRAPHRLRPVPAGAMARGRARRARSSLIRRCSTSACQSTCAASTSGTSASAMPAANATATRSRAAPAPGSRPRSRPTRPPSRRRRRGRSRTRPRSGRAGAERAGRREDRECRVHRHHREQRQEPGRMALLADVVAQEVDVLPEPSADQPVGAVADGQREQDAADALRRPRRPPPPRRRRHRRGTRTASRRPSSPPARGPCSAPCRSRTGRGAEALPRTVSREGSQRRMRYCSRLQVSNRKLIHV